MLSQTVFENRSDKKESPAQNQDYYAFVWGEIRRIAPQAVLLRGPSHLQPAQPSCTSHDLDILVPVDVAAVRMFLTEQGFYRVFKPHAYVERFQRPIAGIPQPYAVDLFKAERFGKGFRLAKSGKFPADPWLTCIVHAIADGKGKAYFEEMLAAIGPEPKNDRIPGFGPLGRVLWQIGNTRLLTIYLLLAGIIRLDMGMIVRYFYRKFLYRLRQLTTKQGLELALLGVDGTGKSTLAKALLHLPVPVKVIYMGADHDHLTRLMRFLYAHNIPESFRKPSYRYEMLVRRISGWIAAKRGWVVIYDRHPAELLVSPRGSFKNILKHFVDRLHAWHVDLTFWLTGNYSVIYERKKEQSVEELQIFDRQYRAMLQNTGMPFEIIDVTKTNFDFVLATISARILAEVHGRSSIRDASAAASRRLVGSSDHAAH